MLKRVPLFADLDDRELRQIAQSMSERTFNAGDAVTTQGDRGVGFFVIEDGTATVTVDGDAKAKLGPGDYFGEIALIADIERTATITAETDLHCWGMTSWTFRPLIESNAQLSWKLLQALARRTAPSSVSS
jgi:CRP-like cAMP-binding protein